MLSDIGNENQKSEFTNKRYSYIVAVQMNKKQQKRLVEIKKMLSSKGLKITPQRIAVYIAATKTKSHPSAESVFKTISKDNPFISFDTVNRSLITFAQKGILNIVEGYSAARFYDHVLEEHHHYRCIKCNTLIDCHYRPYNNLPVPDDVPDKFKIKNKKVIIEGVCKNCQNKK